MVVNIYFSSNWTDIDRHDFSVSLWNLHMWAWQRDKLKQKQWYNKILCYELLSNVLAGLYF